MKTPDPELVQAIDALEKQVAVIKTRLLAAPAEVDTACEFTDELDPRNPITRGDHGERGRLKVFLCKHNVPHRLVGRRLVARLADVQAALTADPPKVPRVVQTIVDDQALAAAAGIKLRSVAGGRSR